MEWCIGAHSELGKGIKTDASTERTP